MNNVIDRCRGSLIGGAIGDSLGSAIEFREPGSFSPITTYRSGGPHGLNAGEWTDDTSMALALADSLKKGWNLNDQASRYVEWLETGKYSVNGWCFDIGSTTRQALEKFIESKDATSSGLTEPDSSGNGSIMRIAPVAIRYHALYPKEIGKLFVLGAESSSVTHASKMCLISAGYMTVVLAALINGISREEVLDENWFEGYAADLEEAKKLYNWHTSAAVPVKDVIRGSYRHKTPPEIKGTGFVVESLEAALWAFYKAIDYKEAVLSAVNLGDDADTTGAVCGQFAGAFWGESGIPLELRQGLARMDTIEDALKGLIL